MMKTELEKTVYIKGVVTARWKLSFRDCDWTAASWRLHNLASIVGNRELAEELRFLKEIAVERARLAS